MQTFFSPKRPTSQSCTIFEIHNFDWKTFRNNEKNVKNLVDMIFFLKKKKRKLHKKAEGSSWARANIILFAHKRRSLSTWYENLLLEHVLHAEKDWRCEELRKRTPRENSALLILQSRFCERPNFPSPAPSRSFCALYRH